MAIDRRGFAAALVTCALVLLPRAASAVATQVYSEGVTSVDPASTDDGNYTVMWTVQPALNTTLWLGESFNGGAWQYTEILAGQYSRVFTGRAPGTYRYRTEKRGMLSLGLSNEPVVTVISYNVGVIPGSTACANGAPMIEIGMDDEDYMNKSSATGWTGRIEVIDQNTRFRFCEVDGRQLKPVSFVPDQMSEYAVLKLGNQCPNGSVEFGRYFDSEDSDNANWWSGDISPNWMNGYGAMMRFCLFRYGPDTLLVSEGYGEAIGWPDLGFPYGVFTGADFIGALASGTVHTDDEDSHPASYFDIPSWLDVGSVYRIVDGYPHYGGNTDLRTALVRYQ